MVVFSMSLNWPWLHSNWTIMAYEKCVCTFFWINKYQFSRFARCKWAKLSQILVCLSLACFQLKQASSSQLVLGSYKYFQAWAQLGLFHSTWKWLMSSNLRFLEFKQSSLAAYSIPFTLLRKLTVKGKKTVRRLK